MEDPIEDEFYCYGCGLNQTEDPRDLCDECENDYLCPMCGNNSVLERDEVCEECTMDHRNEIEEL